eukprot:6212443-Pleurochrysis_carterae.AAC.2
MQRPSQRHVALVGQRRDNQPHRVTQVLVPVPEVGIRLPDDAVVALGVPVVAQLPLPLKLIDPSDALLDHRAHRVARMHVDDEFGGEQPALQRRQLRAHELDHRADACDPLGVVRSERVGRLARVDLVERARDAVSPLDLPGHEHGLRGEGEVPLGHRHLPELGEAVFGDGEPRLDGAFRLWRRGEVDALALGRVEREHHVRLVGVAEGEPLERVETLHQVRLNRVRVARLRQDLQELVVGEKVKARKSLSLRLKVVLQALLDLVQALVGVDKRLEQLGSRHLPDDVGPLVALAHPVLEKLVNLHELDALRRQLLLDVLSREDVLEVHPRALAREPLVEHLRQQRELLLPLLHLSADAAHEARGQDGLQRHLHGANPGAKTVRTGRLLDEGNFRGSMAW